MYRPLMHIIARTMADIAFLSVRDLLIMLFVVRFCQCGTKQDRISERIALTDQQVKLTCQLNSTTDDVTWHLKTGANNFPDIYICRSKQHGQCEPTRLFDQYLDDVYSDFNFTVTRGNETSNLSLTKVLPSKKSQENVHSFKCMSDVLLQEYKVTLIDPSYIVANCAVALPSSEDDKNVGVDLSCEVNSFGLNGTLTFEGIGLNILDAPRSSQIIRNETSKSRTLRFDNFNNIHNASCNAYFSDIDITRSCNYPNIVKTKYITDETDIIVECDIKSDVDWRLFNTDGREENIKNRSWTRRGKDRGQSLLIRNVSAYEVGKVVVCHPRGDISSNGTIIFTVISEIPEETNRKNDKDLKPGRGGDSPFFVPTLLFLALWLITTAAGGVWWGCNPKRNRSQGPNPHLNQSPNSAANSSGGAGERDTHLVNIRTMGRGDPDTSNTNNSANNPSFELEAGRTDQNRLNRQSNNEGHLYFTLEKPSTPTESSKTDSHGDTTTASQPQSSHWQGYETVGESNKGAASSYDLGEYAEVGDHLIGRSLPDQSVRPSIPKKPGKEEIKDDDISRLYGKVNK